MKAVAQYTIRDTSDALIQTQAPLSPVIDTLWLDTSITPNQLKRWDGTQWLVVNDPDNIVQIAVEETLKAEITVDGETGTIEEFASKIVTADGKVTKLNSAVEKITPEYIVNTVTENDKFTNVEQTANKVNWLVSGESATQMTLTEEAAKLVSDSVEITADKINAIANEIDFSANNSVQIIVRDTVDNTAAKELRTGTTVTITDEMVHINSPETKFSIPSADSTEGEEIVSIDEEGLYTKTITADKINCSNIVGTALEPGRYTPASAAELQLLFDGVSNKWLSGVITIVVNKITAGDFTIKGLHGYGMLLIIGATVGTFSSINISDCSCRIKIQTAKITSSGIAATITNSNVVFESITFNAPIGIDASCGSNVILKYCDGNTTTLMNVADQSIVRVMSNSNPVLVPKGVLGVVDGEVYSPFKFEAPTSTPSAPTVVTSGEYTATKTRTWGGDWLSTGTFGDSLYQGTTGGGSLRRGCIWFDNTKFSGRTVVSAILTLKRYSGIGRGGEVTVSIYGTTSETDSGTPAIGTKYASVAAANGSTVTVDVTSAIQAIANGTIKGLMLYDTSTAVLSGKAYTSGYSKFYGTDSDYAPTLSVTFQ